MMGDILDVLSMVIMALLALLPVWAGVALILWAARRAAQIWEQIETAWTNIRRGRADVGIVTMRPGEIKVNRDDLSAVVRAQFEVALQHIDAMRLPANVPQAITYSPHIRQVEAPPAPQLEAPQAAIEPRDLWQLWHAGALPSSGFLLGHNLETGEPVTAGWMQLYSALVGGTSGSGKSTLIRNVLVQSALQGGRFVVLDRHFGAGEESLGASLQPLRGLMMCDVAASERQMIDALRYTLDVGRRRLNGDPDRSPLILVVDETTALFQRSDIAGELATVLGEISQETRKAGVYALCIGQNFNNEVMKTTVRNSFASFFSCRTRRDVARVMSGNNAFGQAAEGLKIGQAVWLDTGGDVVRLAVPNCTQHHVELVARQVGGVYQVDDNTSAPPPLSLPQPAAGQEAGSDDGSDDGSEDYTSTTLTVDSTRVARVRAAIRGGMSKSEILRDVWGVDMRKGGRKVGQASTEYDEIVRALIGGANG